MNEYNEEIMTSEDNNTTSRGKFLDIIVALMGIIGLIVCYFFWGCRYDLPATILAVAVILAGTCLIFVQHNRTEKYFKAKA